MTYGVGGRETQEGEHVWMLMADSIVYGKNKQCCKAVILQLKKNCIVWFLFFKWTSNTIVFCLSKISTGHRVWRYLQSLRVKGPNWNLSTVAKELLHLTSSLFWFVIYDLFKIISLRYSAPTGNSFLFETNWIQNKQKFVQYHVLLIILRTQASVN